MSTKNETHLLKVERNGESLVNWLQGRVAGLGTQQLESLFHQQRIEVNGLAASPHQKVHKGDQIAIYRRFLAEIVPQDLPLEVVYEDEQLLVVNKAAGMPMHPGLGHHQGTLLHALAHHYQKTQQQALVREAVVHRLDKDTSGLVILAKTPIAKKQLENDFRSGLIHRKYEALAWGHLQPSQGTIHLPIGRVPGHSHLIAVDTGEGWGKEAITHYRTLETGEKTSLLELLPQTGRTHQLRIHLHHLGHGLVGDVRYLALDSSAYPRLCLHACELVLTHPTTQQNMRLVKKVDFIAF